MTEAATQKRSVLDNQDTTGTKLTTEGLGDIYQLYRNELETFFACRLRNAQDSRDLVHEIYMRLLRYPPAEAIRQPLGYLFHIAWQVLYEANLRARTERSRRNELEKMTDTDAGGDSLSWLVGGSSKRWGRESGEQLVVQEQLRRALSQLPGATREAFLLLRRDGLSYNEIAEEMKISPHTVKKHIARALKHFKQRYQDPPVG